MGRGAEIWDLEILGLEPKHIFAVVLGGGLVCDLGVVWFRGW